jgi:hypothetical protein
MDDGQRNAGLKRPLFVTVGIVAITLVCLVVGYYLGGATWQLLKGTVRSAGIVEGGEIPSEFSASPTQTENPVDLVTPVVLLPAFSSGTELEAGNQPEEAAPAVQLPCERPERVLIISVDGLRPDAIWDSQAAPFLLSLAKQGAYTWVAQTVAPSVTLPAHTSMLSGYDVPRHGVNENGLWQTPEARVPVKTIFARAKEMGLITVLMAGKGHFSYFNQPEYLDYFLLDNQLTDIKFAGYAVGYLRQHDFNLMLLHFGKVDRTGHTYGWMSPEYLDAVKKADKAIQSVFSALLKKGQLDTTLVIITADHGGTGTGHSDASLSTNRLIPWIIVGPCVQAGHEIQEQVHIYDTAAIALWGLDIAIPSDFDGKMVWEAFIEGTYLVP